MKYYTISTKDDIEVCYL